MDAYHKKRILKELELFPLWKEKNKPSSELHLKPVEADSFFAFKINYTEGSLLLLSQNFASGTEEVAQDLFLNIAKFITTTIGQDTFQKNHLLILTKDQLSDLCLNTPPKHMLAFGLNNQFFEEYKTIFLTNPFKIRIFFDELIFTMNFGYDINGLVCFVAYQPIPIITFFVRDRWF